MQLSLLVTGVQSQGKYLVTLWECTGSYTGSKSPGAEGYDYTYVA